MAMIPRPPVWAVWSWPCAPATAPPGSRPPPASAYWAACANIASEYATKRYRSNVVNWGMLPFVTDGLEELGIAPGDQVLLKGIRSAVESGAEEIDAVLIQNGEEKPLKLRLPAMTAEERDIVLAGCLINYYAKN